MQRIALPRLMSALRTQRLPILTLSKSRLMRVLHLHSGSFVGGGLGRNPEACEDSRKKR